MGFDQAAVNALISAAVSHAQGTGAFRSVNSHEPKSPPGSGLRASVWAQGIRPTTSSGLSITSGIVTLNMRIYGSMLSKPEDEIDPRLLAAVSLLMDQYSGDFTFGGTIRHIDLLGMYGTPLSATAGYLTLGDGTYRIMTLVIPCVINDLWVQGGVPSADETPSRTLQVDSLGVTGGATIGGALTVGGATSLTGGLTVTDGATVDNLTVTAALNTDAVTVSGAASAASLAVSGDLTSGPGGFLVPAPQPVSRRPAYRAPVYSQIFQSGHGWTAGGGGTASSNVNDTSTFIRGTQCVTVTTAANGVQSQVRNTSLTLPSMAGLMIRLIFKVDDVTHLSHINFYVGTSSFSNFFLWTPHTHASGTAVPNYVQSGEWVTVDLQWADVVEGTGSYSVNSHGVPSTKTGFTGMQFAVYDDGIGAVTYHLQAVELVADTTATFPNGVVSVTFDDSYENVFTYARPVMDTYGYRGTLFTIKDVIDSSGTYLTLSQLQQMASVSGWDIQGHAYTDAAHSAGFNTLTARQVSDEMRFLRAWMLSNGFGGDMFAYPHGWFGATSDNVSIEQITAQYWSTARCIISEMTETGPAPAMPYRLRSITGINDGTSLGGKLVSSLIATGNAIDRCASDGSWLILSFHQILAAGATPTASTMCTQTGFTSVMSTINAAGIPVLPISDVIRNYG